MALKKLKDLEFAAGPHSLARDPETGTYSLTKPGGEDPYGVPYHVPVEPVAVPQEDLLRALGSVASELESTSNEASARQKQLETDLAIEKQRVSSAAGVRSGT